MKVSRYIPLLNLRLSEMGAYQELPDSDKDELLPLISLRPWMSAKTLDKAIQRVLKSVGEREWIVDIDTIDLFSDKNKGKDREVISSLKACCEHVNGYSNWYDLVESIKLAVPVLRIENIKTLDDQMSHVNRIGRGFVVRVNVDSISSFDYKNLLEKLSNYDCSNALIIVDRGDLPRGPLSPSTVFEVLELLKLASVKIPLIKLSLSSTSFPYEFKDINDGEQTIYERQLFFKVKRQLGKDLIYSDWGSAREKSMSGGAGLPPPRIDYPLREEWKFKRRTLKSNDDKEDTYFSIAKELIQENYWQSNVRIWGTQMIEKTANEDAYGIVHAGKATAVRINIHLHTQLHYDVVELDTVETDEEWVD